MYETFTWPVQTGIQGSFEPDVTVIKFGSNYEQRQVNGINPLMPTYPIQVIGYDYFCETGCAPNKAKEAAMFLTARGAVEAFWWTPPDTGNTQLFVCRSWQMMKNHGVYTLSGTFEAVPL